MNHSSSKKILFRPKLTSYLNKASVLIIAFSAGFLFVKRGVFACIESLGLMAFIITFGFVLIGSKLDILWQQHEHIKKDGTKRPYKRAVLLLCVTVVAAIFATCLLYHYPYAMIAF